MQIVDENTRGDLVTIRLERNELLALNNALNEVLHGPDAVSDWEFHTRIGVRQAEARLLLEGVGAALERLSRGK